MAQRKARPGFLTVCLAVFLALAILGLLLQCVGYESQDQTRPGNSIESIDIAESPEPDQLPRVYSSLSYDETASFNGYTVSLSSVDVTANGVNVEMLVVPDEDLQVDSSSISGVAADGTRAYASPTYSTTAKAGIGVSLRAPLPTHDVEQLAWTFGDDEATWELPPLEKEDLEEARRESEEAKRKEEQSSELCWKTWDEDSAPNYVKTVGEAQIRQNVDAGQVYYAGLDEGGRAGLVAAMLTPSMRNQAKDRGRQDIDVNPAGWPSNNPETEVVTPDGSIYQGVFWNRSHLLADSLGGDPRRDNLITGTRMQNVGANDGAGGMAYTETIARDWLDSHSDGALYYSALPLYEGNESIPRAVVVDMKSSDGSIDIEVVVYNAAKGYAIDYSSGSISKK